MFLHPELAWRLAKQRHLADLEIAATHRMVRMARQHKMPETYWPSRMIWRLGALMVTTGSRLQRYHQPMETFAVHTRKTMAP